MVVNQLKVLQSASEKKTMAKKFAEDMEEIKNSLNYKSDELSNG